MLDNKTPNQLWYRINDTLNEREVKKPAFSQWFRPKLIGSLAFCLALVLSINIYTQVALESEVNGYLDEMFADDYISMEQDADINIEILGTFEES
ncbi:hypothetical protein HOH87_03770 [bacterium]|jgi:hypothetical protein|nr:hypothetical protein [bacterium]